MKTLAFASRNTKEIVRDKINLLFGLGFPLILLFLLSLMRANMPSGLFAVEYLTPGITVFGFSFISLFAGMIVAKDRTSSFMLRLFTSPMTSGNFICGYLLPLLPMVICQTAICFLAALALGLDFTVNIFAAMAVLLPCSIIFIGMGLLCGCIFTEKQVGGVCGALLTNLTAWLSGTWFDTSIAGNVFDTIAHLLPFCHAVDAGRAALSGDYSAIMSDLLWVFGYAIVVTILAIVVFQRKIAADK
ncbi:ABC transporter efflux protein%2C DrrB family [uncultured Eubacterium sp.]|nr:ABC transporter efflux protein%2C DrrB family [uncultured Eubacterium sp.]